MTKKKKIFFGFCVALIITAFQFLLDRNEHLKLQRNGIITKANSVCKKRDTYYAVFSFSTKAGEKIEGANKCGSEETFDREYANMQVIYNPNKPQEYQNLYDFNHYSLPYRIFFFFGIYLIILTALLYVVVRAIHGLYDFCRQMTKQ